VSENAKLVAQTLDQTIPTRTPIFLMARAHLSQVTLLASLPRCAAAEGFPCITPQTTVCKHTKLYNVILSQRCSV